MGRFLGAQALAAHALGALKVDVQPANGWMASPGRTYVNGPGGGEVADGWRVLFLYYAIMHLEFAVDEIVEAVVVDLAGVDRNVTGKTDDPFLHPNEGLDWRYPSPSTASDHPDNPWPIGHLAEDLIDDDVPMIDWDMAAGSSALDSSLALVARRQSRPYIGGGRSRRARSWGERRRLARKRLLAGTGRRGHA